MKSLLASVQLMRQHLGYLTVITHSRPGDKGRTAQVERVSQTLRKQSSTLVHMASDKCGLQLPGDHTLWSRAFIHAAWTLKRFYYHTTTRMSPFELVFGRRYFGKVVSFGRWFYGCIAGDPMSSLDLNGYLGFGSPQLRVMIFTLRQFPMGFFVEKPGHMVINLGEDDGTPADEGKPPQVTAAELRSLDEAAVAMSSKSQQLKTWRKEWFFPHAV